MARPRIIVTGASGLAGRHLLEELKECFQIYAFDRRTQAQCGAPVHANICWTQVDIADLEPLTSAFGWIREAGPVDASQTRRRKVEALLAEHTDGTFGTYRRFDRQELAVRVLAAIRNLRMTIRTREMEPVGGHCLGVARDRFEEGFSVHEVCAAFSNLGAICIETLKETDPPPGLERALTERIAMAIQFGIDEILDEFETLETDGDEPCGRFR
jgi:hypothetical protein